MRWDHVQYFLAVVDHGSLGAAARALRVNHSTVLRHLGALEAALATRLFDRLPTGYVLTPHGQVLARDLAGLADTVEAATRQLAGVDVQPRGVLRLTAPDTLLQGVLMPHLAAFCEAYPAIRLELVADNQFLSLARREADVAVRGSNRPPELLVGRRVATVRSAVCAAPASSHAARDDETRWRWIVPDESLSALASADWLRRNVPEERIALRVNSLLALADAVAAGIGVGWVLQPLARMRGLQQLRPPLAELDTDLWVLSHPALRRVARVTALTRFLAERLAADPLLAPAPEADGGASARNRPGSPASTAAAR